jgi:hypothetical protein
VLTKKLFMKKNVFTLLLFVFMSGAAFAQTEKGSWLVGGNLDLNTANNNTIIGFSPMAGFFFSDNFAAGAAFDYYHQNAGGAKSTNFGFGPLARYYFGSSNVRPLVHAQWNYISRKTTVTSNGGEVFVAGGLAAFINRNVAIEGLAGYDYTKFRHNAEGDGGFKLKIGFQVYLSGSQMSRATGQ